MAAPASPGQILSLPCPGSDTKLGPIATYPSMLWVSQAVQLVKNLPASTGDARDLGLIPGLGRSPGEGNGDPLQYSCLGDPMDRGAWWATVHGVTESDTTDRLSTHAPTDMCDSSCQSVSEEQATWLKNGHKTRTDLFQRHTNGQ